MFGWLNPGENYLIVYQIPQLLDTTTYYVQAVVKDANGNILNTINLTDKGSQRFEGVWKVCQDRTMSGTWINITITTYEDTGYTTPSANYGASVTTYLVLDRTKLAWAFAGGVGAQTQVDYKEIQSIIKKEISKSIEGIKFPKIPKPEKQEKTDLSPIEKSINSLGDSLNEKLNNSDIERKIDSIPDEFKKYISVLLQRIEKIESSLKDNQKENQSLSVEQQKSLQEFKRDFGAMEESISSIVGKFGQEVPPFFEKLENKIEEDMNSLLSKPIEFKPLEGNLSLKNNPEQPNRAQSRAQSLMDYA